MIKRYIKNNSSQYDLFNPELDCIITKLNERFGNNAVRFVKEKEDKRVKVTSDNIEESRKKLKTLLGSYQELDKNITELLKLRNYDQRNLLQLKKEKEKIKKAYVLLKRKVHSIEIK